MSLVYADRVKETTTTTGTGTLTLAGAATGFQSFAAIGNGNTCIYALEDANGAGWEVGVGTYTSSGVTLARTTVLASSNSGSAITLSAGTHSVYVTADARVMQYAERSRNSGLFLLRNNGSATDQTITLNTYTAIGSGLLNTKVIDENTWVSGARYTPQRAGYYQLGGLVVLYTMADGAKVQVGISRNGGTPGSNPQDFVFLSRGYTGNTNSTAGFGGSQVMYANGSTDYFDLMCYHDSSGTIKAGSTQNYCYFWGYWLHG